MAKKEAELERLRERLAEAEETLEAIRTGEVDALVVNGTDGEQIYTLRGADHPYRLLLQEMNEGAATLMADGMVLYCNKRFAAMLHAPLEKVIGYPLKDFAEPSSAPLLQALLRSGKHLRVKEEIAFATPQGPTPVYCSIGPVSLDGIDCLSLVATDLTEQKRNEEIIASEKLAREILDRAADVIVVCNEHGEITHASRAAHELAGTTAVLHQRFDEVFSLTFRNGEPVICSTGLDATGERSFVGSCLSGRIVQGVEVEFVRGDGRKFDLLMGAGPLRDTRDQSRGCVFTLTDITRLKVAEEELRESQAHLAAELETMGRLHQVSMRLFGARELGTALHEILEASMALDGADFGNVQLYNPEKGVLEIVAQRGFQREFLDFFSVVTVDDDSACARAMRGGERVIIEDVTTDAGYAPYREIAAGAGYRAVQSTPLVSRAGELLGMLSTHFRLPHRPSDRERRMLDLYARNAADSIVQLRAEEKLRRQAAELEQQLIASGRLVSLGEITASMAHEFNNPLGIAMGFAEDLLSEKKPEDADYQPLRIIHEETKRCQKIIQDLLEYSRPRSVEKRDADVAELIQKSVKLIANLLHKHKVAGELDVEPNLPLIDADPQQIEQVLVNLYLNAIDAMPDGGRLVVSARRAGDEKLEIAVTDTGIGIAPDELGKIFQPFFSAKKKSGLGLGLPICTRIVANHGGTIDVESRPGEGTTFRIHLPVKRVAAEEAAERAVG